VKVRNDVKVRNELQQVTCNNGDCLSTSFRLYKNEKRQTVIITCSGCGAVKLEYRERRPTPAKSMVARARSNAMTPEERSARARLGALGKAAKFRQAQEGGELES
jgi:hypothetical protein